MQIKQWLNPDPNINNNIIINLIMIKNLTQNKISIKLEVFPNSI